MVLTICGTLCEHNPNKGLKLSTCGQALGGELLFKQRLGFSGTPSDILPVELGQCHYEKGSDAKMMFLLGSPAVVSHEVLDGGWSVRSILEVSFFLEGTNIDACFKNQ